MSISLFDGVQRWLQATTLLRRDETRRSTGRRRRRPEVAAELLEVRALLSALLVTNLDDSGMGSLRDAVEQANNLPGADVISFDANLAGTISLTSGELAITDELTISGPGADELSISGSDLSRVFRVDDGDATTLIPVEINGLTIRDGQADIAGGVGGGIFNAEALVLQNMVMRKNTALGDPADPLLVPGPTGLAPAAGGGAIYITPGALLTVETSQFLENLALSPAGTQSQGGAIFNRGSAEISASHFIDNMVESGSGVTSVAASGGAIGGRDGASLVVSHSEFHGNQAAGGDGLVPFQGSSSGNGGAISNVFGSNVDISHSTFSQNLAMNGSGGITPSSGGAIFNGFFSTMSVDSSVVARNQSLGGPGGDLGGSAVGGGIANIIGSNLTVAGSSFLHNKAIGMTGPAGVVGGFGSGGAIINEQFSSVTVNETVFVNNQAIGGEGGDGANGGRGEGGGLTSSGDAVAVISNSSLIGNRAIGGAAGQGGIGGVGQGGALLNDVAPEFGFTFGLMTVSDTLIAGNRALGGSGAVAGNAFGGGILNFEPATLNLSRSLVLGNRATGGDGDTGGNGYGGGLFVGAAGDVTVEDTLISLNRARGGQGTATAQNGEGIGGGSYVEEDDKTSFELIDSLSVLNFDDSGFSNTVFGPIVSNL